MQRKVFLTSTLIPLVILAAAASSYFSPYWTLYQMKQAYERRDAAAFSSYIDFPALRTSVKAQMQARVRDKLTQRLHGGFLASLGAAVASNVTDPLVDQLVSPASIEQVFRESPSTEAKAPSTAVAGSAPDAASSAAPDALPSATRPAATVASANPAPDASATSMDAAHPAAAPKSHFLIAYRDWSTVTAQVIGDSAPATKPRNPLWSTRNTFVLSRIGLWSWQLTAIELPPDTNP